MFLRVLLSCFLVCRLQAAPLQVEIHAKNAILVNADTGTVLFEKNPDQPAHPASITKIATALHVIDKLDPGKTTVISEECLRKKPAKERGDHIPSYWLEEQGTSLGLVKGEEVSIETLLHGMMLCSGNDAANALAELAGGSLPRFMQDLNQTLVQIGCTRTRFYNPHGLHHEEHITTARDMALITIQALKNPKFRSIVCKRSYHKPKSNKKRESEIKQANRLLQEGGPFFYSKAIGVKTGFTSKAKSNLVAAAEHEGRTLIAVLMGCEKKEDRYLDAIALFENAFAEKKIHRVLLETHKRYQKTVEGAKAALTAFLPTELAIDFYPAEEPRVRAEIHWTIPQLPIEKGTLVGKVLLFADSKKVKEVPLFAEKRVEATWTHFLKTLFRLK